MALVLADRVRETTTTTGTGTVTLAGAAYSAQSFAAIGNGNTTYYVIAGQNTSEWEMGVGTYTASGTTLSRDTVLSSSNAGSLVSFSAGVKDVFVSYPATRAINLDATGNLAQTITVGLGTGRLPVDQYYGLDTGVVGLNATGAQSIFGVGVTLAASTIYQFEGNFCFVKTVGATATSLAVGFGGTATVNNIGYSGIGKNINGTYGTRGTVLGGVNFATTTANSSVIGSFASATQVNYVFIKGIVSINAGGTFIPQYFLGAAPGGAFTTAVGSYFKISPLAAAGANVNIGNWA